MRVLPFVLVICLLAAGCAAGRRSDSEDSNSGRQHKRAGSWFHRFFGLSSASSSSESKSSLDSRSEENSDESSSSRYPVMRQKVLTHPQSSKKLCFTVQRVPVCTKAAIKSKQLLTQVRCQRFDSEKEAGLQKRSLEKRIQGGERIHGMFQQQSTIRVQQDVECSVKIAKGSQETGISGMREDFQQPGLVEEVNAVLDAQSRYEHPAVAPATEDLSKGFYGVQCPPDVAAAVGVQLSCAADCVAAHNQLGGECGDASKKDFNCYCNKKLFKNLQLLPLIRQHCPVQCYSEDRKEDYDELCKVDCMCNHGATSARCNYKTKACMCEGRSTLEEQKQLCKFNSTLAMADYLNDLKLPNVEFGRQLENGTVLPPPALVRCEGILQRVLFNVTGM